VTTLSKHLRNNEIIFSDTGGNLTWTCNSLMTKLGQQVHSSWNHTPMGYSLPAAIGAAFHNLDRGITCIIGDGGLMICMAELANLAYHRLPIKVFLFNNHSHGIQKQTLETWLDGNMVCVDPQSGVAFPSSWVNLAETLGVKAFTIDSIHHLDKTLKEIYEIEGPVFINVEINPNQKLHPVLKFGSPLEMQSPSLPDGVVRQEMLVKQYDDATIVPPSQGW
jgi:acetolactate synthase-1/2/3 large subunit